MDKIIRELYQNLIRDMTCEDEVSQEMKAEILYMLKESVHEESQISEQYKDQIFRAASAAEEAGFVRGFRYAFHLFLECVSDKSIGF